MQRLRDIPWPRILAEGSAIVVSILLAFAIDAWWEERQEQEARLERLQNLRIEFDESRAFLQEQAGQVESALEATRALVAMMGPADAVDNAGAAMGYLGQTLNVGLFVPEQETLAIVMSDRDHMRTFSPDLRGKLRVWQTLAADIQRDSDNLERSREEALMNRLVYLGLSLSALLVTEDSPESLRSFFPASRFEPGWLTLLSDPGTETILTMRAIRLQILLLLHQEAIDTATGVLEALEAVANP